MGFKPSYGEGCVVVFGAVRLDDGRSPSSADGWQVPTLNTPHTPEFQNSGAGYPKILSAPILGNPVQIDRFSNIPAELTKYRNWVVWKYEVENGEKPKKVPYDAVTSRHASVTNANTWTTFDNAISSLSGSTDYSGVGFVLDTASGFAGIDLDNCHIGAMTPQQQRIFDALQPYGYAEDSPSGNGIHIIVKGSIPKGRRIPGIEIYADARFFTVTGNVIHPGPIQDAQPALDAIFAEWPGTDISPQGHADQPQILEDRAVWDKAADAANGSKFQTLWAGDWSDSYPSQSQADQALMNFLCHHSPNDSQCIGMFWQSGLGQREKAQRSDYVLGLIKAARSKPVKLPDVPNELRRSLTALWEAKRGAVPSPVPADEILPTVDASSLAGQPIPERRWLVDDVIPGDNVTLIYGDGAAGKSLLILQLAVAALRGRDWLGWPVRAAVKVLGLFAEDDLPELHRRLVPIAHSQGVTLRDLAGLVLAPLAGVDALLAAPRANGATLQPTALFIALVARIAALRPGLLIIDTLADAFGGNEVDRAQVRQFVGMLRKLAIDYEMAVVVLAHPSLSGMNSGSGTSGSTAWNNSVRSRLYLKRDETNPEIRTLELMKANYAATGKQVILQWRNGVFEPISHAENGSAHRQASEHSVDELFLEILTEFSARGQNVSRAPTSTNFAPKLFASHPKATGTTKQGFADAMGRLFSSGRISETFIGPPSKSKAVITHSHSMFGLPAGPTEAVQPPSNYPANSNFGVPTPMETPLPAPLPTTADSPTNYLPSSPPIPP
ncbi:AAA family ATPase [Novosphingobium sp.]|uniref:AAA family ATPase n=1 Tax=Novosphingobium sp. TaxID=1874826 RepID=UPI0038B776E6